MNEFLNQNTKFVPKNWGYEFWIANSSLYCGKDLFIKKDKQISLHYHKLKDETFLVQSGQVRLICYQDPDLDRCFKTWEDLDQDPIDLDSFILNEGDVFHIPVGMRHTLFAYQDSHVFEFSTQHFDEDSYRILNSSERNQ